MDAAAARYIEAIGEHRPLFDRVHDLILHRHPTADVALSYNMPTYRVGGRSLIVGVWKHGLSIYGLDSAQLARIADVIDRHSLRTSRGTLWIRPADAAAMTDDDIGALVDVALGEPSSP